jgi:hypothetical protein
MASSQPTRRPRLASISSNTESDPMERRAMTARAQLANSADPLPRYAKSPACHWPFCSPWGGLFTWWTSRNPTLCRWMTGFSMLRRKRRYVPLRAGIPADVGERGVRDDQVARVLGEDLVQQGREPLPRLAVLRHHQDVVERGGLLRGCHAQPGHHAIPHLSQVALVVFRLDDQDAQLLGRRQPEKR